MCSRIYHCDLGKDVCKQERKITDVLCWVCFTLNNLMIGRVKKIHLLVTSIAS